jgi:MFS family permease
LTRNSAKPPIPRGIKILLAVNFFAIVAIAGEATILGKQVYDMTGRALDLGLLGLAEFLPTAILAPFTGSIADRYDRRFVAGAGLAAEAGVAIALFAYIRTDPSSVGPIFALALAFGAARALLAPALRALPVDMAPPDQVERVVALNSVAFQSGAIVGPVLAGFVFVIGPQWPYAVTAALALFTVFGLSRLPRSNVAQLESGVPGEGMVRQAYEGLKFIRRTPVLFGAISLDLFAVLLGGAVALLPAIAEDRLGVGAVGLGWLRAAVGIGAATTAVLLARSPVTRHIGRVLLVSVAVFGVATIVLGLTRSFAVAFAAIAILGAADAISVFIRSTLVPLATPEEMRGRVLAVEAVFIGASNELGAFESGVAASVLGIVGAVLFGGFGTLAVVGIWWVAFPKLRDIDRFAEVRPEQ